MDAITDFDPAIASAAEPVALAPGDAVEAPADPSRRQVPRWRSRSTLVLATIAALLLGVVGVIAAPMGRDEPEPAAVQLGERSASFGVSHSVPIGPVGTYIRTYAVEHVWDAANARLTELPPEGFASWLRSAPGFVVESETPVTIIGQETTTIRFRADLASASGEVPMLTGAPTDQANGIRFWPADRVGLATALDFGRWTVVIEAMLPIDDATRDDGTSAEQIEAAYAAVLASTRPDTPQSGQSWGEGAEDQRPYDPVLPGSESFRPMSFPAVGDWSARYEGWGYLLTDLGSGGPEGRDTFLTIRLMPVLCVPASDGSCPIASGDGFARWLERDSGLTVLAKTPIDGQQATTAYELVAPGQQTGTSLSDSVTSIKLWKVGHQQSLDVTPGYVGPDDGSLYEVDRGARLMVTPISTDQQLFVLVAELPYLPVEQTPTRPVDQLRRDYAAIAAGITW